MAVSRSAALGYGQAQVLSNSKVHTLTLHVSGSHPPWRVAGLGLGWDLVVPMEMDFRVRG